jgi:hypothetical protein
MLDLRRAILVAFTFVFAFGITASGTCAGVSAAGLHAETFERLDKARADRRSTIEARLAHLAAKTEHVGDDPILMRLFSETRGTTMGTEATHMLGKASLELDQHYVEQYSEFYDILFVDTDGLVFFSVKMESDFRRNLFAGNLAETELARDLRRNPDVRFVDYDFYGPSDEIAAFFVRRVVANGQSLGWIVFQFSVNDINTALADHEGLGRTGEIYLTNRKKLMITQSRLLPQDDGLTLEVDTLALKLAFENERGNALITDYRGKWVFSSFEQFSFAGAMWVMVAEIDEDEVITEFYRHHKGDLLVPIVGMVDGGKPIPAAPEAFLAKHERVDINEYGRAGVGTAIATYGVATCTGIAITRPGKFTYLGHIYPLDAVYLGWWDRMAMKLGFTLQDENHASGMADLVDGMVRRILRFDIYAAEVGTLRAKIFAVHTRSLGRVIDRLLDAGLFLSQITLTINDTSRSVSAVAMGGKDLHALRWTSRIDTDPDTWSTPDSGMNFSDLVKAASGYQSDAMSSGGPSL